MEDIGVAPEFAIADGIVRLTNERQELAATRELEVLKMRGANYVTGRHFFDVTADGLIFYPRVRAPDDDRRSAARLRETDTHRYRRT